MLDVLNPANSLNDWYVTNDGVMGGLSSGSVNLKDKVVVFSGNISIDNNGGFTSTFKKITMLPGNTKLINICVMGDGHVYQLRVKSQVMGYEITYKIDFFTRENTIENYTFSLADLTASFRGRRIDNAPLLKASSISHVGFLISAKQPISFSLSVHNIDFGT